VVPGEKEILPPTGPLLEVGAGVGPGERGVGVTGVALGVGPGGTMVAVGAIVFGVGLAGTVVAVAGIALAVGLGGTEVGEARRTMGVGLGGTGVAVEVGAWGVGLGGLGVAGIACSVEVGMPLRDVAVASCAWGVYTGGMGVARRFPSGRLQPASSSAGMIIAARRKWDIDAEFELWDFIVQASFRITGNGCREGVWSSAGSQLVFPGHFGVVGMAVNSPRIMTQNHENRAGFSEWGRNKKVGSHIPHRTPMAGGREIAELALHPAKYAGQAKRRTGREKKGEFSAPVLPALCRRHMCVFFTGFSPEGHRDDVRAQR
jgi:hypothetical protein